MIQSNKVRKSHQLLDKNCRNRRRQSGHFVHVTSHVRLDCAWMWKGQSTDGTLEWTFSSVSPHVCPKICRLAEPLVTYTALVWLWLVVNGAPMLLQTARKLKLCRAVWTQICIFLAVYLAYVTPQHGWQFETFATFSTREWPVVSVFEDYMPSQ